MAKELNAKDFQAEIIDSKSTAMVDFWTPWCGPCRMMGPIVDKLADEHAGKVNIAKVNIDDNPDLAAKYNVTTIPTLVFFKDGDSVYTSIGVVSEDELNKIIKEKLL